MTISDFLTLDDQQGLDVPGTDLDTYNIDYNFADGKLIYGDPTGSKWSSFYRVSPSLLMCVKAAIVTGRPLLLRGEPGCGKTKLARAIAVQLYGKKAYKYYFEWHVKSKSNAQEGGYNFDHVGRLRDATISGDDKSTQKAKDAKNYVTLGPMGRAFASTPGADQRAILLIDEIDKGDIDFPNDLLLELDEMRFKVHELDNHFISASAENPPLVFITSNNERELPPAFLRRCLYYFIEPFTAVDLANIVKMKLPEIKKEINIDHELHALAKKIDTISKTFIDIKKNKPGKKPSTSELLDWMKLITYQHHYHDKSLDAVIEDGDLRNIALKLMV